MYLESETLNRLRADKAALSRQIERLVAGTGGAAGDTAAKERLAALRERLQSVQEELDRLELAEELGRQRDA